MRGYRRILAGIVVGIGLTAGVPLSMAGAGPAVLTTQASPSVALGGSIFDTATVSPYVPGAAPRGRVVFRLYGPTDPTCAGTPLFQSGQRVDNSGTATSEPFTPTTAGTYRWVANFAGDANNPAIGRTACDDPNEQTVVTPPPPTLTTQASPTVPVGGSLFDTGTVNGYLPGADPRGRIIFRLFGPDDPTCAGTPLFQSAQRVDSFGVATSEVFVPTAAGTYRWQASFAGDDLNSPLERTACNDPLEQTVVTGGPATSPVGVFRPSDGTWFVNGGPTVVWGTTGDIQVPADYDGDGDDDIAVLRPSDGIWFVNGGATVAWGTTGDIPVPADYDGDGDDDIAVFRPAGGIWFVNGGPTVAWGTTGDIPVPADYDGDGDDDIAVFRPSDGIWFVNGGPTVAWGTTGDIPVPADYDGDGDDDIAVFRPSDGIWFVNGGATVAWGTTGDIPVPADYDGDGDDDIAVFRPSLGLWLVNGGATVAFGTAGDRPLPLPAAIQSVFFG